MNVDDLVLGPRMKGIPWKWGGRNVEEGFDCRTLVFHLLTERAGLDVEPSHVWFQEDADLPEMERFLEERGRVWRKLEGGEPPKPFDVVVTRNRTEDGPAVHFTTVLDERGVSGLTVTKKTGVARVPIEGLIDVIGRYRYEGESNG